MLDELHQPLRQRGRLRRLFDARPSALRAASFGFAGLAGAAALWLALAPPPPADEPVVHLRIERGDPIVTASGRPQPEPDAADDDGDGETDLERMRRELDASRAVAQPNALDIDQLARTREEAAVVSLSRVSLVPAPVERVSERGPHGLLPRVAKDGRKPFDVYARPTPKGLLAADKPKIALMIGGMGLNPELTARAVERLPGEVSFAFAPYGNDLQVQVNRARLGGHEVMLQLPMEPFGYPAVDPGPNTLTAAAPPERTLDSLAWLMSRFAGYAGVTNYMGARFTADETAIAPVVRELGRRGLVYVDDGSSGTSRVAAVGGPAGLPVETATRVIDADGSRTGIAAALAALEADATRTGFALGTGTGLPATIEAVEAWAKDLAERGFVLVPVSATFRPRGA